MLPILCFSVGMGGIGENQEKAKAFGDIGNINYSADSLRVGKKVTLSGVQALLYLRR